MSFLAKIVILQSIFHKTIPNFILPMDKFAADHKKEPEIVYSRSVKAGKRIYYFDVKKARNEDLYISITESKRTTAGNAEMPQFEKHKLFLYKEDFNHFAEAFEDILAYAKSELGEIEDREPEAEKTELLSDADSVSPATDTPSVLPSESDASSASLPESEDSASDKKRFKFFGRRK